MERKQVSFLLSGVPVPDSVEWNGDSVIEKVVRGVGVALDVDPSRIKDVALQELDWVRHYLFTSVQDEYLPLVVKRFLHPVVQMYVVCH